MSVTVLRSPGIGGLLTALPALRALRRAFPRQPLRLAAPAALESLVDVLDVEHVPVEDLRLPSPAALRGSDLAVDLHGPGPKSTAWLRMTEPRRLVGFGVTSEWEDGEHEVARWCRLLRESGVDATPSLRELRLPVPPTPAVHLCGVTVVHPGAGSAARRWPVERFARVAAAEALDGRRVVVTGTADEVDLARAVATAAGLDGDCLLAGRLSLTGLSRIVAHASRVVCGDTGVAHLATAHGTPSVVLFGPVGPHEWGPVPGGPHVALWTGRDGDPEGATLDPGLDAIGVDAALAALAALPNGVSGSVRAAGSARRRAATWP